MSKWNTGTEVIEKENIKLKKPKLYKVILHNDDYTTMEFVVYILKSVFRKSEEEAMSLMMDVHKKGTGVCGVYTYEIAESKQNKVMVLARQEEHPLRCTLEEE